MKNEIILYRPNELAEHIEVSIDQEKETVWLTQSQIAELFQRDRTVITKHLRNIFSSDELDEKSNVQKMHIANSDKPVVLYNLDVILSVGYRVNSKQGTQFRIWANRVLKDYLLKGYTINTRMNRLEDNFESLKNKVDQIDLQINTQLIPTQYQSPSSILPQREEVVPSLKRNQWRKLFPFRQLTEITRGEKTFGEPVEKLVVSLSNHGLPFQNWINNWCLEFYS